ncbi:Large subunit terminase [Acidisarcina polymorpha]|uniref:Large subunit terminase n=1 Tax=Acidisarcina polymorpha TaxID=2211140 RepID=A0A2Z5G300_9BACT|nr:Large subunit terminase [Acidisarcina polymorpha]
MFLAESLLRVRDKKGKQAPLRANRAQREYERRRGQNNIVLKARQMGISTWIAGRFFLKTITQPGTLTVQVAHSQEAAESIFRCVHRFLGALPASLRNGALKTARASSRQIVFPALDSEYRVETAGDRNAGRGVTIQNLHCSEVARWPGDAAETLAGLRAALPKDGELVLESTPNGADGCFYEEWQRGMEDGRSGESAGGGLVRHFFPWWWDADYVGDPVAKAQYSVEERQLAERYGLRGEQIGFRRRMEAGFRHLARQEYAEDADACFLSSGACVFDVASVDARLRELPEPVEARDGGELLIWYPPETGRDYIVAVDPAGGGAAGDFSAAQVIETTTGLQCAELQGKLETLELALRVAALAREYGTAILVVERNNHGSGVLAYLRSVCRYPRVYKQEGQDGWLTSSLSRPEMIGTMSAALVESAGTFQSRRLMKECRTFIRFRNGKTGAESGSHDDCLMAMAIGLAARHEMAGRASRKSDGMRRPILSI